MRQIRFSYCVSVVMELTESEAIFLRDQALLHYDFTCKSAAIPGKDAFLNAAINSIRNGIATVEWTFRECDITRKILEQATFFPEHREMAFSIDKALREAQQEINLITSQMNTM